MSPEAEAVDRDRREKLFLTWGKRRGLNVLYSLEGRLVAGIAAGGASTWTPGGIQWERESYWTKRRSEENGAHDSTMKRYSVVEEGGSAERDVAGAREIGRSGGSARACKLSCI
jgi:hypothetical protein